MSGTLEVHWTEEHTTIFNVDGDGTLSFSTDEHRGRQVVEVVDVEGDSIITAGEIAEAVEDV